jgi:hypothetical protein
MGISMDEFWAKSTNGKAMVGMLVRRGDVEMVRDICEWLVDQRQLAHFGSLMKQGSLSEEACKLSAQTAVAGIRAMAESINDRNAQTESIRVIDAVFQREYNQGQQVYTRAMADFANALRAKVTDEPA